MPGVEETIDGSMSDVEETIDGAMPDLEGAIDGLMPGVEKTIDGSMSDVEETIGGSMPDLEEAIDGLMPGVEETIDGSMPDMEGTIDGSIPDVEETIDGSMPDMEGAIDGSMPNMIETMPDMEEAVDGSMSDVEETSDESMPDLEGAIDGLMPGVEETTDGSMSEMEETINGLMPNMMGTIDESMPDVEGSMPDVVSTTDRSVTDMEGGSISGSMPNMMGTIDGSIPDMEGTIDGSMDYIDDTASAPTGDIVEALNGPITVAASAPTAIVEDVLSGPISADEGDTLIAPIPIGPGLSIGGNKRKRRSATIKHQRNQVSINQSAIKKRRQKRFAPPSLSVDLMDYLTYQLYQNSDAGEETFETDPIDFLGEDRDDDDDDDDDNDDDDDDDDDEYADDKPALKGISKEEIQNSTNIYRLMLKYRNTKDLSDLNDIMAFSREDIYWFGYKAEDFILECSFDKTNCSHESFTQLYNKKYGNCYTFNSAINSNNSRIFRTRKYGSQYGLRLTLNINASEYVGLLASDYGARVLVHPANSIPYPDLDGYDAPPGINTAIGITHVGITRLPYPFETQCMNQYPKHLEPLIAKNGAHIFYNIRTCQLACIDLHLVRNCQCTNTEPFSNKTLNRIFPVCESMQQNHCKNKVLRWFGLPKGNSKAINCECRPSCEEVIYRRTISQSKWPSQQYQTMKINNFYGLDDPFANMLGSFNSYKSSVDFVRDNIVRLQFYYQELNYETIVEKEAYGLKNLIADIGGIIGLYVGLSIMAVFEIVFYILNLGFHIFKIAVWDPPENSTHPQSYSNGKPVSVQDNNNKPPPINYPSVPNVGIDIGPPGSY